MDLNHYALEQMVKARLAEARLARRRWAVAASAEPEVAAREEAEGAEQGSRRFVRWFFGVPGRVASHRSSP
jgi:hypothetical protein